MTRTKVDNVREVYLRHDGKTKAECVESVEALLRLAKDALIGGDNLLLSGLGKFSVKYKKERKGRNPQTGSELILSPRRVVTFDPSRLLRDKVNQEHERQSCA